MKLNHIIAATLLSVATVLLIACGNQANDIVTINYEQIGACNGFNNGDGITSAGTNAAYVAFRISDISNKDSAARDFNFDPDKVYVNPSTPRAYTSSHLNLAQLNPFYATSRFVPKGTSSTLNGAVIAVVSTSTTPDPAKEANNTSYFLAYDTPAGDQGVLLVKKDPNRTSWPSTSDCTMIVY